MSRIKDLWNRSSQEIQNILLQYPLTVFGIFILTLIKVFFDFNLTIVDKLMIPFLCLLCIGLFFCESAFFKQFQQKIISIGLVSMLSLFLTYMRFQEGDIVSRDAWIPRIIIAYAAVFLLCGIYSCYRNSGQTLPQYGIKVFSNLIKIHIVFVILTIGVLGISAIIYALFIDDYSFDISGKMLMMVIGFYYTPSWLYTLSRVKSKAESFTRILVEYVLLPLTIIVYVIIYVYIIKILILMEIPSNQIYSILTGVFVLGVPTWTMMESLEEQTVLYKISQKLPLFFTPLILLQIYAVGIRIVEFGVTPSRYLGVLWIILESIYLLLYWTKKDSVGNIILIGAGTIVIALLVPFVNMFSVSNFSQEQILSQYKKGESLSEETQKKVYGAYIYLSEMSDSEQYIDEKYSLEEIEEIKGFSNSYWEYESSDILYINTEKYLDDINVQGFSRMQIVQYNMDYEDPRPNLKEIPFTDQWTETVVLTADLEELINHYVNYALEHVKENENDVNIDDYYFENSRISLDENTVLIIRDFQIIYDRDTEQVEELELSCYLLSKNIQENVQ